MIFAAPVCSGPYRQIVMVWRRRWERYGDAVIAVALFCLAEIEVSYRDTGAHSIWLVRLLIVPPASLPLVFRRTYPTAGFVLAAAPNTVATVAGGNVDTFYALVLVVLIALYSGGAYAERQVWIVPVVGLAAFWASDLKAHHPFNEYFASATLVIGPWLAGRAIHYHRRQAAQLQQLAADLVIERDRAETAAAAAERGRIAREMHDVIAHALSVIAVQADAASAALEVRPELAPPAVATIQAVTRESLAEMRRVLHLIHDDEPPPSPATLGDLDRLVARMRTETLRVDLTVTGDLSNLSAAADLTAYRVVQESLTNVRKHSQSSRATVSAHTEAGWLSVEVTSDGPPVGVPNQASGGYGLRGLRERVEAHGGSLSAGAEGGGWRVRATLPAAVPATT